jgi:predicted esterase
VRSVAWSILFALLIACTTARAAPASRPVRSPSQPASRPTTKPLARKGTFHITFTDQSPLSPAGEQNRRYHLGLEAANRYKLEDESFEVHVPPGDADRPYGIFVWINAADRGAPSKSLLPMLEHKHLIWIGANNAGNPRGLGVRLGLAIDAVHNLKQLDRIDENRVYVSGISGGGKVASIAAVCYPDVFTGSIPICGVSYFRNIPVPGEQRKFWPGIYSRPPIKLFDQARERSRFVLITGEKDPNRPPTHAFYEQGFVKDKFKHVEYVEVPGMGHSIPEAKWIEEAIDALDRPLELEKK